MSSEEAAPPRGEKKKASTATGSAVRVSSDAFRQLSAQAKDLRLTNMEYASAAITYFTRNGLDPTAQETVGLISLQAKMSEIGLEVRKHNADIGNRLVAILRTWEANQYKFMQAQQGGILGYLEDIETNILNQLVAIESQLLAPLIERVVRNGIDAHLTRMLTEVMMLKTKDTKFSTEELKTSTTDYDAQRDRRLVTEVRKLLETTTIAPPKPTQKPTLAVPVLGPPAKPTASTTPANPTLVQPKS